MATKPTIYKLRIALSDLERNYYDTVALTVALHPSETPERMMARVMAYCINAQPSLSFTKGLSEVDEPDIWVQTLDDNIALWIDVGEPAPDRVKKATRLADEVQIFAFNSKVDVWWDQHGSKLSLLNAAFYRFESQHICKLAELLTRTMDMSVTITGESAYIATANGELELGWTSLTNKS